LSSRLKSQAHSKNAELMPKMPNLCKKCRAYAKNAKHTPKTPALSKKKRLAQRNQLVG